MQKISGHVRHSPPKTIFSCMTFVLFVCDCHRSIVLLIATNQTILMIRIIRGNYV